MGAMSSPPRIYIDAPLDEGQAVSLDEKQTKYLTRVMRLEDGADLRVFNGRSGEWRARLVHESAKRVLVEPVVCTREQSAAPDLTLLFAPLRLMTAFAHSRDASRRSRISTASNCASTALARCASACAEIKRSDE